MTRWSQYCHYDCENCGSICINRSSTDPAQLNICVDCYDDLPETVLKSATSEGGRESPPSHGGPTDRVSARDDRREDPSQRESPAEGPERGCGVLSRLTASSSTGSDE